MTLEAKSFRYEFDSETSVATITLDRPDRLNALTFEVYAELRDVFRALDTEPDVRTVVLTGRGRGFCSGGDVEEIIGALFEKDFQGLLEFTRLTGDLILAMRQCRKPVLAALNGTVAGAGAVMAAASDIRVGGESAKIAFLFTKVGLSGADMGAAWLLPRIVGHGRASELLLTGDFVTAKEAYRMGLYNHIVEDDRVLSHTTALAERLAAGPALGLEITKAAIDREATMDLATALEAEAQIQAACMLHSDFREAYDSFREKRKPRFR